MIDFINLDLKEDFHEYTLSNGVHVIIDKSDKYQSVTLGFYLLKGSRNENIHECGYSHFTEHMLFKGTHKYDKKEIANRFDRMSGNVNAYTSHESLVIYNRIPYYFLEESLDLMHDIYQNSIFSNDEIILEKKVILNEMKQELEDPHEKIFDDFMKNIYPQNPLGMPIIGTAASIKSIERDKIFEFYQQTCDGSNLLIIICGKVDEVKVLSLLEQYPFRKGEARNDLITQHILPQKKRESTKLASAEQVHIILGTNKFETTNEMDIRLGILNAILGETMSSRFFQRIREDLGLCYSIYTFFNRYRFENLFGLYLSLLPKYANKAIGAVSKVIKELVKEGITKTEFDYAKTQRLSETFMNYDLLQKRMSRIAYMKVKLGKLYSVNEIIKILDNTTIEELNDFIKKLFISENYFTQVVYKDKIILKDWEF